MLKANLQLRETKTDIFQLVLYNCLSILGNKLKVHVVKLTWPDVVVTVLVISSCKFTIS